MDRSRGNRDKGETQIGGNVHRLLRSCAWSRDIDFHRPDSFTLCVSCDCPLSVLFCFRTVISFSFSSARPLCFPLSILLLRRSVHPRTKIIVWVQCLCGHRVRAHPASSAAIQLLLPTAVTCRLSSDKVWLWNETPRLLPNGNTDTLLGTIAWWFEERALASGMCLFVVAKDKLCKGQMVEVV